MNYDGAYKLLKNVAGYTDNQIELLIADVQCMRLCQRQSRNKDFYSYRENALRKMRRIEEEKNELTDRQMMRIIYATTEFHIINSTYFYYVGLKNQSIDVMDFNKHQCKLIEKIPSHKDEIIIFSGGIIQYQFHLSYNYQ